MPTYRYSSHICLFNCLSKGYQGQDNPYFGALIGRVANRVKNAVINIDNNKIAVAKNFNDKHQLHGGFVGFDKHNWKSVVNGKTVIFSHFSEDGDEGYPGDLTTTCTVSLDDENSFTLLFKASSTKPTHVNLTNHSYFNLAGHASGYQEIYKHVVSLSADHITETDEDSIPTGKLQEVLNTPYDLREPKKLGPALAKLSAYGFDDNFCVNKGNANSVDFVGRAVHEDSGRYMEVYSDQPGVQFYTSNYMPDPDDAIHPGNKKVMASPNTGKAICGKHGALYGKHGAFCYETQKFPDASNHKHFPSTLLMPGDEYKHVCVYKFGVEK